MDDSLRFESPLHPSLLDSVNSRGALLGLNGPGFDVTESDFRHQWVLRSHDSPALARAMSDSCRAELPLDPNTSVRFDRGRMIWLSPSRWCALWDAGSEPSPEWEQLGFPLVDVSSGQCLLRISGPSARELLSAGCTLDLHPEVFCLHAAAQSLLAKAPITLILVDDRPVFELIVRRSYAPYLWRWLEVTTRSFG